jgi:hypothetical protein
VCAAASLRHHISNKQQLNAITNKTIKHKNMKYVYFLFKIKDKTSRKAKYNKLQGVPKNMTVFSR